MKVTRNVDSVISSAAFADPRNTTRASDAAAFAVKIVKQELDRDLRAPKPGLALDLRKMRIRVRQRDADLCAPSIRRRRSRQFEQIVLQQPRRIVPAERDRMRAPPLTVRPSQHAVEQEQRRRRRLLLL